MFTEYLETHPLSEMLREEQRELYPPAENRPAWESLSEKLKGEIRELAEVYGGIPYPLRTATGFLAFSRDGSRQADEGPYFTRRRKLCAAVLRCCAFPEEGSLDEVVDGVWTICEESSWVISAHNINPIPGAPTPREKPLPEPGDAYIDLFSAQTGMILSLTAALLGKELDGVSPVITARIRAEIQRRMLEPFLTHDEFWWMGVQRKDLNNWTPWILSNLMICATLSPMDTEALAAFLTRACGMLDRFLEIVPEDGGCDEGVGYWNMAAGALLDCLTLLERLTGGEMTFWQESKIRNMMIFPRLVAVRNGWFVNFADCDARPFLSGERLETAGRRIGDPELTAMGARLRGTLGDQLRDVPHFTRALDLLFHPEEEIPETREKEPRDLYLPDLQIRILERGDWFLACKGGHNGENHNHNDVGSFILYLEGEPAVVDAGNMVYTAKTFSTERNTLWNIRGAYHNLPLIGGREEAPGREHGAREARRLPEGMELDFAEAYEPEAGVTSLSRSFSLTPAGLRMRDEIRLQEEKEITWVFLLRRRPEAEDRGIRAGELRIRWTGDLDFTAEEIPMTDARMARNWKESLWRVLLRSPSGTRHEETFSFSRNAER